MFFESEEVWGPIGRKEPYDIGLGSGQNETALIDEARDHGRPGVASATLDSLRRCVRYHFHDTSRTAGMKQPQPVNDSRELRRDARNLAPFLHRLKQGGDPSLDRIRDAVRTIAPFFDDFILTPDTAVDTILLEWGHRDSDVFGDASMLSDGTLRFICLATVLLQPAPPSVLLIDEPELGLHPYATTQLAEMLQAASERCQIIVSTQSVTLLDRLAVEDIVIAERVDGSTTLARDSLDEAARVGREVSWRRRCVARDRTRTMLIRDTPVVAVTTMLDLYGLPSDVPGVSPAIGQPPYDRVATVEATMASEMNDPRFRAYLQLHEFEALVFTAPDLSAGRANNAAVGTTMTKSVRSAGGADSSTKAPARHRPSASRPVGRAT